MSPVHLAAHLLGIGVNQVHFLVCQLIAITCGQFLRCKLPPGPGKEKLRHWFEFVTGFAILYIGYGWDIKHLIFQAIPAYLMLVTLPLAFAQYGILIFSLAYLSAVHISQLYNDNQSSLDITAPLMVQTQKLSSLAFNINDGYKIASGTPVARDSHKCNAIRQRPRLLQLGGYLFCFHNCMIGPFHFFADYLRFIEGREVDRFEDTSLQQRFNERKDELRRASAELRKQLKLLSLHTVLTLWAFSSFKPDQLISEEFARKSFFQRYLFMTVACFSFRQKFYFAWTLSCIANLSAGFGFSGFDSQGSPEYRFATNIHFFAIEFGTSTKAILDSWNTATTRWLRDSVYDRVPKQYAVWCVFIASAVWHGFHPGFYMAFVSAAAVTLSGRSCRRYLRPYFRGSSSARLIYDVITHVCALFCLNYLGAAFLLLKAHRVIYFWRQMRFLGHIVPLLLIILLPLICSKPTETSKLDPSSIPIQKAIKLQETIRPSEKPISSNLA